MLPLRPALNGKITNHSVLLSRSLLRPQCDNASPVSCLDFFRLTNASRYDLDAAVSKSGSNDLTGTFRNISGWLCELGTS